MPWNPDKYHQFQSQRSAPFYDLLKLLEVRKNLRVVDLGCGTGKLTRELADILPDSHVVGIDSSPQMLARTNEYVRSGLRFEQGNQTELQGGWDLIFSNAALQWSQDHEELIPYLFDRLAPNGQLLVQMPSNHGGPVHLIIRDIAGREPFHAALGGWTRQTPVLSLEAYAGLLFQCDAQEIVVFEKIYPHVLENSQAVLDWISGTALIPYFERLGALKDQFVETIKEALDAVMPDSPVFYPFRRMLLSARKER
jgi:trans-aconitate 2-methyltransferase